MMKSMVNTMQMEPKQVDRKRVQIEDHREIDCGNSEILSPSVSNESYGQGNQADKLGVPTGPCQAIKPPHYGYTLTIDNIDMNFRRSFQRLDRTTVISLLPCVCSLWTVQC